MVRKRARRARGRRVAEKAQAKREPALPLDTYEEWIRRQVEAYLAKERRLKSKS